MTNTNNYKFYEILFSLRKEYLKNQEIINKLLSYVKITNNTSDIYEPNLIFETRNKINSLLLIISKKQSCIKTIFNSLVESDPNLEHGKFLYVFRLTNDFVYLLDGNQDGRYLNSNVSIINPKEFIELYKYLLDNTIFKKENTNIIFEKGLMQLNNNGINLLLDNNNKYIKLNYDGIKDNIRINNNSYIKKLLDFQINKDNIPTNVRNLIDNNMEDFRYTIEKKDYNGVYEIENDNNKLILKIKEKH